MIFKSMARYNFGKVGCIFMVILMFIGRSYALLMGFHRCKEHSSFRSNRGSRRYLGVSPCARQQGNLHPFLSLGPWLIITTDHPRDLPTNAVLPLLHRRRCDTTDTRPDAETSRQARTNGEFRKDTVKGPAMTGTRVKHDIVKSIDYFHVSQFFLFVSYS